MPNHRCHPARSAFSLIELMVVIVIIGLLLSIAVPVMGRIEAKSRAVEEMSCARAAVSAWRDYAVARDGEVLRGYYPESEPSTEALFDFNGDLIAPGPTQERWFWRLTPYLDDAKRTLYPSALEEFRRENIDVPDHQYVATLHPAFGLNGEWIGGQGEALTNALYAIYEYGNLDRCPWIRRLSDIRNTSKLIVFGSSRFGSTDNSSMASETVEGFHRIESPYHPSNGYRWASASGGGVLDTMTEDPADHGYVSARHDGKAVTAMADGSTALENPSKIGDMRRWADMAWKRDWVLMD
ncbi:MAG: type II secretion system protein [Phycisphaerales bacterium]|nr:type II secretion system protein [Phycisphaerales bacterium]